MATAYDNLSFEQKGTVQALIAYAKREKRPDIFIEAAVFTGLREQNLENQPYGSGTSLGWRQEIEGKGTPAQRMSFAYSIPHFYRECAEIYQPGMPANELAERVQRPEQPYPEQAQSLALAQSIIQDAPTSPANFKFGPSPSQGSTLQPATSSVVVQQSDPKDPSPKIKASGKHLSLTGQHFTGHTAALRSLLTRGIKF
jgi:hypothetical protein